MKRKDAIHENEPYILVEVPEGGNVGFFGKWLSAAAKADALWNKAIKDHIFKEQVLRKHPVSTAATILWEDRWQRLIPKADLL